MWGRKTHRGSFCNCLLENLPDTFPKKQIYSTVPLRCVKDKHKDTRALWDDKKGREETVNKAIKQSLFITLLLPLNINLELPLGELLSFYLKK